METLQRLDKVEAIIINYVYDRLIVIGVEPFWQHISSQNAGKKIKEEKEATLKHSLNGSRVQKEAFQRVGVWEGPRRQQNGCWRGRSPASPLQAQLRAISPSDQEAGARRQL